MTYVEFSRWRLCVDPDATRHAYADIDKGGAEKCACCHCRNFIAARQDVYPAGVLHLFDSLGIDPSKEVEVYHLNRLDSGLHLYGGFFHFGGYIEAGKDAIQPSSAIELEAVSDLFSLGFTAQASLVAPALAEMQVAQLEFLAQVPWRLTDHPEPT